MLLRPDGTLPAFGNTDAGSHEILTFIPDVGTGKLRKVSGPFFATTRNDSSLPGLGICTLVVTISSSQPKR